MAYTTDLTLPQFEVLDQLLPKSKTRGYLVSRHLIVNAVFYQLKNGCQWRDLPADFPNWQTVYSQCAPVADGRNVGSRVERVGEQRAGSEKKPIPKFVDRRFDVRQKHGYSQQRDQRLLPVQCDERHQAASAGGRAGHPYFVYSTRADIGDDDGLLAIIKQHKAYFLSLPPAHRVTILLDNGYHKDYLEQKPEQIGSLLQTRITIELSAKITPLQRAAAKQADPTKQGFVAVPKRWIVERTNTRLNQCRVLWKNCEGLLKTSEAKIRICAIRLILRRIA